MRVPVPLLLRPEAIEALRRRALADPSFGKDPRAIPLAERQRELAGERARGVRDSPPEAYRPALEAWGFRRELRLPGWRHGETGSTMSAEEAAKVGDAVLRASGWVPGVAVEAWVQPELRMAFLDDDLSAMFPGKDGPYNLWHWLAHQVGKRLGHETCSECGKALGPVPRCSACTREMRSGRCPVCSMVPVVASVAR